MRHPFLYHPALTHVDECIGVTVPRVLRMGFFLLDHFVTLSGSTRTLWGRFATSQAV